MIEVHNQALSQGKLLHIANIREIVLLKDASFSLELRFPYPIVIHTTLDGYEIVPPLRIWHTHPSKSYYNLTFP